MNVEDLMVAFVAIAKDPKAWEKRIEQAKEAAGDLAEARRLKDETKQAAAEAAKDLETARYERDQADRSERNTAAQAASTDARARELAALEADFITRRNTFETEAQNWKANADQREAGLETREREAVKKLDEATKLMADYDEAKHQAALKLAS